MLGKLYYTVVFSLIKGLDKKTAKQKEDILAEIVVLLINEGVCTLQDVKEAKQRFEDLIKEVEEKIKGGLSYSEAFIQASKDINEFDFTMLN